MQDAVREWDDAVAAGDIATLRAMVRRAFPTSALNPPAHAGTALPNVSLGRATPA